MTNPVAVLAPRDPELLGPALGRLQHVFFGLRCDEDREAVFLFVSLGLFEGILEIRDTPPSSRMASVSGFELVEVGLDGREVVSMLDGPYSVLVRIGVR